MKEKQEDDAILDVAPKGDAPVALVFPTSTLCKSMAKTSFVAI